MKKMISCLAILVMLAAVPTATAFAAETATFSVPAEAAFDETDIRNLVGQWKYQIAPEGMNITAGVIDNGIIDIKSDSTYKYTDLDGKISTGTIKLDYDTFGGDYRVPFFAFYEGDKFFIGCYCQQNNPNAYIIGNGGTAQLLSVDADFSAITGEWEELNGNERIFSISANGVYTVTYPDNSSDQGFIKIGNEMFSDNNDSKCYNFYNSNGIAWIGFPKTDSGTVNELKTGSFTLRRKNTDQRNEYGYYTPSEYPVTSVSTAALIGTWTDAKNDKAILTITEGRNLYNSKFEYTNGTETISGFISLEYCLTQSGDREYWYNFYNVDGTFWNGFRVNSEIPLNDIYSGQDGAMHFVRKPYEKLADKNEIAVVRMNDLNTILSVMNASPKYTEENKVIDGYVKVTDFRFSSISDIKNFISSICTGELKDELISDCDNCFTEKEDALYVKSVHRSFYQFRTEKDVTITDPAMNYFSATTNDRDSLFGYGKAEFFYDDDKWLIKNYEFIDSFESEKHDISEIAGTWNEVDTLYPRTLVIKNDGSFTITFTNGGTMYGIAKVEEIGYPNGSIMTWFNLYKESGEFYTGFEATSQTPLSDLYTGLDCTEHFVRYIEPEHKYSAEELRNMSINDYEKKTGIRPASSEVFENNHGVTTVVLKDENGNILDTYTLDPATGQGANSKNEPIELPQTGVNSLTLASKFAGASVITLLGIIAVIKSGMLRKKEDEE